MSAEPARAGADRLSFGRLVAFSLPGAPIGALAVALSVYLPRYYASHFGLGLAVVGAAFMTVRLIDMFFDLAIGFFMDKTRTRLGRYRVWLIAGAPLLAIAVIMLFAPPVAVSYGYLVAWLLLYFLGASVVTLSHIAWASATAGAYHERSRVFGMIQFVSVLAAVAVLVIPAVVGGRDAAAGVRAMGWFIAASAPIGAALAAALTRERIAPNASPERFRLRDYWEMVSRPDMRRIVISDVCLTLGPQWMASTYLYYFHDARGFDDAASSLLLLIYVASQTVGAAALSWLATRIGKHRTLMLSAASFSVVLVGANFLPKGLFWTAAVFMFAIGFTASSFVVMIRAMTGDVGDAVRLETGRQRIGLLFAFLVSVEKIANAFSIGLTFNLLALFGYDAREGAINTAGAIRSLEIVFLAGPVVFVMIGGACFLGYALDDRRHGEIRKALDARDAGLAALDAAPDFGLPAVFVSASAPAPPPQTP